MQEANKAMVITSYHPGNGVQGQASSHGAVYTGPARSGTPSRPQRYACARPSTLVQQVVLNPALTPYQCGICLIFYTSEVDLLERHIEETHRRHNRQVASYGPIQSAQPRGLPCVTNVSQPQQQEFHGFPYVGYQSPWVTTLRPTTVRGGAGVASLLTYTHNIHGSQPSPGTAYASPYRASTLAAQPVDQHQHSSMAAAASVPVIAGEWPSIGVTQVQGVRTDRGTTRGSRDGPSPGVKRSLPYPELRPPPGDSSRRKADESNEMESTARISGATEQQSDTMMIFEQPDLGQEQLVACASVPLTYRDPAPGLAQDTALTASSAASAAKEGPAEGLDIVPQHSSAESTGSAKDDGINAQSKQQRQCTQSDVASEGEKIHPSGAELHHPPGERFNESLDGAGCLSASEQHLGADKTADVADQHTSTTEGELVHLTTAAPVTSTRVAMIAFNSDHDGARSAEHSAIGVQQSSLEPASILNVSSTQTALLVAENNSTGLPPLVRTHNAQLEVVSEFRQATDDDTQPQADVGSQRLLQEDEGASGTRRDEIHDSRKDLV